MDEVQVLAALGMELDRNRNIENEKEQEKLVLTALLAMESGDMKRTINKQIKMINKSLDKLRRYAQDYMIRIATINAHIAIRTGTW